MDQVRHDDGVFEIDGIEAFQHRNDETFAPLELLADVSAASLSNAIRDMIRHYEVDDYSMREVRLTAVPAEYFDRDLSPRMSTTLELDDDGLVVVQRVDLGVDEDDDVAWLDRILQPLGRRLGTNVNVVHDPEEWPGSVFISVAPSNRGRTVGDLLEFARPFATLAEAARGKGLSPSTAADVLRGAYPTALIGQPESQWLDVKRTAPRVESDVERVEFAKDVAAFANTREGGLIVYGLRAAKTPSGEVIDRVTPFPPSMMSPKQLTAIVRRRVHPYPLGMRVELVPLAEESAVGLVLVPPQLDARKPFLVSGTVMRGKVREMYVGLPMRAGEDTLWDDIAGVHALMVAGRAALNRHPD
jgi:hypothetical protein